MSTDRVTTRHEGKARHRAPRPPTFSGMGAEEVNQQRVAVALYGPIALPTWALVSTR